MKARHHTVPNKSYLKNFSDLNGHVWVLDRDNKIYNTNPINVFVEKHFYTVTLKNGDKSLFIEDTLGNIESAYASLFRNKLSKDVYLTEEERATAAIFFAALLIRTGSYRRHMRAGLQKVQAFGKEFQKRVEVNPDIKGIPSTMDVSGDSFTLDELSEVVDNFDEFHSATLLPQLPEMAQIIFNMKWSILKSKVQSFVTCDTPAVLMRPEAIAKYGPKAIGSSPGLIYKDVELTVPLSKDRALLAGWRLDRDSYLRVDDDMVEQINYRTIIHASQRIVASSKRQLDEIKELPSENVNRK